MSSVLVIMCCIHKMAPKYVKLNKIDPNIISELLLMLSLNPEPLLKRCDDWSYLLNLLHNKDSFKKNIYDSLREFIIILSHEHHLMKPEWLFSLPLLHLLREQIQPFQELELNPQKIPWKDDEINLGSIKNKTYDKDIFLW